MSFDSWFYTNLPGYNENWLWWGDKLWYDSWTNAFVMKPLWIQIISWNDSEESHDNGPQNDNA
ncbi:hypothetical protein CCHL11_07890 [Colletotrichum chlorophyti]|uniref:Uncharacterized protein n=1 Tax=Colletotrichum chlorophyti TaxID=708187 RepID=A0A1Q8RR68_9PEZI|nr:hypothetical protein CCHL11_07890 [Colletotrichum chlorophyti]